MLVYLSSFWVYKKDALCLESDYVGKHIYINVWKGIKVVERERERREKEKGG